MNAHVSINVSVIEPKAGGDSNWYITGVVFNNNEQLRGPTPALTRMLSTPTQADGERANIGASASVSAAMHIPISLSVTCCEHIFLRVAPFSVLLYDDAPESGSNQALTTSFDVERNKPAIRYHHTHHTSRADATKFKLCGVSQRGVECHELECMVDCFVFVFVLSREVSVWMGDFRLSRDQRLITHTCLSALD